MPQKSVSILGCGWLGLPLARHLVRLGFLVKGSTTTPEKLPVLKDSGIIPFLINCDPSLKGEKTKDFFDANILFLNIPFKHSLKDPKFYKQQVEAVMAAVKASPIQFVIFASSTSIYPSLGQEVLEDSPIKPNHPRAKVLFEIEQALLNNNQFETTIIRFAGLYGKTRPIGRLFRQTTEILAKDGPVNLIHLDDAVEIVARIIQQDIRGEIFNACSDAHPTKGELYTQLAAQRKVKIPEFTETMKEKGKEEYKIVSNQKLKTRLNYTFKHPTPL